MVDVTIVSTPDDGSCGIGTYTGTLKNALPESVTVESVYVELGVLDPRQYVRAAVQAGRSRANVVHVQHEYGIYGPKSLFSWIFFPLLWLITLVRGQRVVITMHSAWNTHTIGPPLIPLKRIYVAINNRMISTVADKLVFLSENCKDDFRQSVAVDDYEVLPHGVETDTIDLEQSAAKRSFGYDPEELLVVEPGFVRPEKGVDIFVDIARRVPDYSFLIAGGRQENYEDYYRQVMADLPDNTTVTGTLDDEQFHAVFVAADLVVLPYREVTQSGIFNLCVAYECPVAGSDRPYFQELDKKYNCVRRFDPDNIEDGTQQVEALLNDKESRSELVAAMSEYRATASFKNVGRCHRDIYQSMDRAAALGRTSS